MKKIKLSLILASLFVLSLFYFTACSENEVSAPTQLNFNSPEFSVIDFIDTENGIEDATLNNDMTFNGTLLNYSFMNMGNNFTPGNPLFKGNRWLERFDFGKHLGLIFRKLALNEDQKAKTKEFMKAYHDAIKPLVKKFYEANKELIQETSKNRKAIVEDLKAGKITKEEAAAKLKELNEATRDKIKSNPESQKIRDEMCAERSKLFKNIESILTTDQLAKWKEMTAKMKNPC